MDQKIDDKAEAFAVISTNGTYFRHCSDRLLDSDDVARYAMKKDYSNFRYCSERLRGDSEFVSAILEDNNMSRVYDVQRYFAGHVREQYDVISSLTPDVTQRLEILKNTLKEEPPPLPHPPRSPPKTS